MGNIHGEVSKGERIPVRDSGEIVLRKIKKFIGRLVVEDAWIVEYFVGRTSCEFCLIKINRNKHDEEVSISIHDDAPGLSNYLDFQMNIGVEEDLLWLKFHINGPRSMVKLPERKSNNPHAQGGVLECTSYFYGRDTDERKGLVIILRAKRSDDEVWPYMITMKHYLFVHAYSSDVGLCVVTKIRNDNGEGLSVQLEKPVLQPRRYLLSMFDDVIRTGWTPNYSVDFEMEHSSLVSSNQNQGKVKKVTPVLCSNGAKKNNTPAPEPYGYNSMSGQQNVSSVINTSGYTNANYNGSFILENCQVWFDKDGKMFRSY